MLELNNLYNMDCMDGMREFPDKYFDLAIVDPPYFKDVNTLHYYGASASKTGVKRKAYKKCDVWDVPTQLYYDELLRVSKAQIIWGINYYDFKNVPSGRIVWDKKINIKGSFSDCEIASCSLIRTVRKFEYQWSGFLQGDMKNREKRIHPTQKPVKLYEWILQNYAKPGYKILDTHAGSASSLIACYNMGFDYIGFEIDEFYYGEAKKRMSEHMAQIRFDF